jgi:hypothetical protein
MASPTPPRHRRDEPAAGLTAERAPLRSTAKRQLWWLLELFALTSFVVAQPLLDVLGRSPDFLLFRQADARDIVLLAVAIVLVPPVVLWGLAMPAGLLGRPAQRVVHRVLVAGLLGLLGLEVAKKLVPLRGPALAAVGVLTGVLGGLLYAKRSAFRMWLRFLWPAPIVFLLVFLLLSPTAQLLKPPPVQAAAAPQRGKPGPIVVVFMDEFPLMSLLDRRGDIDRRLYPNIARLAAGSTWYRNATGVSGLTGWAVPSMLTGRYPAEDLVPIVSQYPDNLFTLLGQSYRYRMRVFEGMSQLCPPVTCPDAKPTGDNGGVGGALRGEGGLRRVLRDSAGVWTQIVSPREPTTDPTATLEEATVDSGGSAADLAPTADPNRRREIFKRYKRGISFQRFLSSIRRPADPDKPALYFVHVLMPHQPWKYLPSGRTYPERRFGEPASRNGRWVSEPWAVQSMHHRHLLQVAVADRMVGTLVKRLRDVGLYDRSLLVVTADHGMAFDPGEPARASVTGATAAPVLWVPLFIKRPGQHAPSITDVNWEHVDLVPTIADIMGFRVPWSVEGVSWANPSAARRSRTQKWFYPRPGTRQVLEGPANQARVLQGVTDRLLRPQDGYLGWFKFGPHADLVGRRVHDLTAAGSGGTAQVSGLDDFRRVDPDSGTVPAHVGGRLTSTAPDTSPRPAVVVAVNGVIGGVSETFASGDAQPTWFSAMVPDTLFRPGDNQLQLFLLSTTGGQQRLHPLTLTG